MALRLLGIRTNLIKAFQNLTVAIKPNAPTTIVPVLSTNYIATRDATFFVKLPAKNLWSSVTSVSNAGAKKGRGRGMGRKMVRDLNRGQYIGKGKINMLWPGLSAPIIRGRELVTQQRLPDDPERLAKLIKLRDFMGGFRRLKLGPLERGWSGAKMHGRKIGPPDPIGDFNFDGFETIVLSFHPFVIMRKIGRVRRLQSFVVTGNGNGVAGFAFGNSKEGTVSLKRAKNRAGQKLLHFNIYNGHGIYHDFFTQFGSTKLFVTKQPEGHGLVCHRAIKAICEVVGIKDIHVKVEGSVNVINMTRAFFIGLLGQKTHQEIAEDKRLHLVEFRKENEYFPKVVASPTGPLRTAAQIPKDENLDFTLYSWRNKVFLQKKKWPRFYTRMRHYDIYLWKKEKRRNHEKIRKELKLEYGELTSFVKQKYPNDYNPCNVG